MAQQLHSGAWENPYAGHRQMRPREQEVLGEYARLAATIKRIDHLSTEIASSDKHAVMLHDLRVLERKMGLVLTLFKASVWSLIQTHEDEMEQQQEQQDDDDASGRYDENEAQDEQGDDQTMRAASRVDDGDTNSQHPAGRHSVQMRYSQLRRT